jgi:hypothetical protein
MATGERSIKIRITGDAKGLKGATRDAEDAVDGMNKGILGKFKGLATQIPDMLSGIIDSLPPQGKVLAVAIGGGLAAALAPILAAGITSALLLAVGGGALALGIKAAIDNPKVAAAFDGLKKKGAKLFEDFGKPFEQPLIRAAKTFGKVIDDLRPYVERIGKIIAPVIDKLAPALGDFLKRMMPGIEKAVKASVPLFETLADKLPGIGEKLGLFFELISENGDDANLFLSDFIDLVGNVIVGIGKAISVLTSWYSNVRDFLSKAKTRFVEFKVAAIAELGKLLDAAVKALSWIPGIGPKLDAAQKEFREFQQQANAELKKIKDREVSITISTNIGTIAGQFARLGAQIANSGAKVSGKRADGGSVMAGRSYLVGEKGPEIVTFGNNGYVTPNHKLGGGGDTYVAYVDLGNGIQQRVELEFKKQNRQTRAAVLARG